MLAVVLMVWGASAQATTYDLGTIGANRYVFSADNLSGAFDDVITFYSPYYSFYTFAFYDLAASPFSVLPGGDNFYPNEGLTTKALAGEGAFNFGAGHSSINLSGIAGAIAIAADGTRTFQPGRYYFELVSTVPEPGTWLMLIVGAGFMLWRLRATQNAPSRQGLA